jgi:hypothetical protein
MAVERCVHGMDGRFCAICNKSSRSARPAAAIADTTLEEILRFLDDEQARATYDAVGEVLGVGARSLVARLGQDRGASRIVDAANGVTDVIGSGAQLALQMAAWKARR